jgi:hypothetical protein
MTRKVGNLIYEIYWFFKSLFMRKNNGTKFDADDDDDGHEDETVVSPLFMDNNEESDSACYRV